MFEKRHLCAVADLLAHDMQDLDVSGREYVADKLAGLFESHNPRFKPSLFYKAAEVTAPWERSCPSAEVEPEPVKCRNCGRPDTWHDEVDGTCPDDEGPHPYSEASLAAELEA